MTTRNIDSVNAYYHFLHYQGDTFNFTFKYLDNDGNPISLSGATAEMSIRKSPTSPNLVCLLTDDYPNGAFGPSGDSSEFGYTGGVTSGTGGIRLENSGVTGSINIIINGDTTSKLPTTRTHYNLQITTSDGESRTILSGTFEIAKQTTR